MELHVLPYIFLYLIKVFPILLWKNNLHYSGPFCCKDLLFQSAYRQYPALQSHLSCHSQLMVNSLVHEDRGNGRCHCNACRRTILWYSAGRHMNMYIMSVEHIYINSKMLCS